MNFFRTRIYRKLRKPVSGNDTEGRSLPLADDSRGGTGRGGDTSTDNSAVADPLANTGDEDDEFIADEVCRRLKELRRNSFMMLIPEEESCAEDDEAEAEDEMNTCEWRDVEAEGRRWWGGFDVVYDKYCERMLFFDRTSSQQLREAGFQIVASPLPSPKRSYKKLASPFRCLSLKDMDDLEGEKEFLQSPQHDPYVDLETAYVGQCCLSWEALHCQYTQLRQRVSCHPDSRTCYNHSAQQFQQFHVLLQRFIENEPFQQGLRPEVYARSRTALSKLIQVPNVNGSVRKVDESESDFVVHAPDLLRVMENSIITFHVFLKLDKKKHNVGFQLLGNQNHRATSFQMVQSLTEKKNLKLKEQCKKCKGWKRNSWPRNYFDVELLFGLIDLELLSRVLRMVKITKDQLFWCEEKLKKIDLSNGTIRRDPSPTLFPC